MVEIEKNFVQKYWNDPPQFFQAIDEEQANKLPELRSDTLKKAIDYVSKGNQVIFPCLSLDLTFLFYLEGEIFVAKPTVLSNNAFRRQHTTFKNQTTFNSYTLECKNQFYTCEQLFLNIL